MLKKQVQLSRDVMLVIHREFPGAENAKFRTAIKNAISSSALDKLDRPFKRLGLSLQLTYVKNQLATELYFADRNTLEVH